jgi:hypothetical protein
VRGVVGSGMVVSSRSGISARATRCRAAQEVHLDLSELPQLCDHCLSRILTSLAANLVSLKLNGAHCVV